MLRKYNSRSVLLTYYESIVMLNRIFPCIGCFVFCAITYDVLASTALAQSQQDLARSERTYDNLIRNECYREALRTSKEMVQVAEKLYRTNPVKLSDYLIS